MAQNIKFKNSRLTAFGSTRHPHTKPASCPNLKALVKAGTSAGAIVGKSWDLHVTEILKTDLNENLAMIADSIDYLKSMGKEVLFDAEHFFDGYKNNPRYTTKVVKTALAAGADMIVLCDTNGGCMPHEISETLEAAVENAARDAEASGVVEPVVLLSPACASFDQYRNFEIRGTAFRDLVTALPGVKPVV